MFFKIKILIFLISIKFQKWYFRNDFNALRNIRWKNLRKKLESSEFYKDFAEKSTRLQDFPVINKSVLMSEFDKINTVGIKKIDAFLLAEQAELTRDFSPMLNDITIGLSSGTSGNRGIFLASENERAMWVAVVLDHVIGFSLKKRSVAFFMRANSNLYDSVKSNLLDFKFYDILTPIGEQINNLNFQSPTILVAQPSVLNELAALKENGKLNIQPKKIISIAEVLYPEDKIRLEKKFGQIIHQVYQCTEGLLAVTCQFGTLHFNEDFIIIEKKYIDTDHKRFHPVITDLLRVSQPIIRYELNDIIHEKNSCPCRSKSLAIDRIEGRSDDILEFINSTGSTIKIYPDFIRRAIIMSDESINDYSLVQIKAKEMSLYIDNGDNVYTRAEKAIIDLLNKFEITDVTISRSYSKHLDVGAKFRRIKNEYRKTN